ncbi:MAG: protein kinase [Chloroflexota bacterium]
MTDLSGQYVGRYHLIERLGEGGMAVVYRAYDTRLERDVAIKIIRHDAFPPETLDQVLKRFEREAKSLARLAHPNIIKVHDFGEHEGSPYLVMEYLPGGTLKKMLGQPVPWPEVFRLLLPVAQGVAYAHAHGILHRDIKPANILITADNKPMLTDFGIAKVLEGNNLPALTVSGMFMGTPEYMAPEQWTGETSPQSDIYSMGIVIYEMITGRKPYVADTPAAILLKQSSEPLPRPGEFAPGLPETVERLLIKALARDAKDRYEDMNAMVSAMESLVPPHPAKPMTPQGGDSEPSKQEPSVPERREPVPSLRYWIVAAVVLIGIVGAVYMLRQAPSDQTGIIPDASQPASTEMAGEYSTPTAPASSPESGMDALAASSTPDPCSGASRPGARQKFPLDQILPCLDTVSKVSAFMANNMQRDDDWDAEMCGEICYSPAWLVYQNGVDDLHGLVTLECYILEKNGWDAYHVGLSIESAVGTNVCGVNTDQGVLILDADGKIVDTFDSLADVAHFYISHGSMVDGGQLRTIKASLITQPTTLSTSPSLTGLPWEFHPY